MFMVPPVLASESSPFEPETVWYIGKDTETKGDWQNAEQSPLGTYGSYAHILPNSPLIGVQVPVGGYYPVPVGEELQPIPPPPPVLWTTSQWEGLHYYSDYGGLDGSYRTDPPYWDEYVGSPSPLDPPVTYSLSGTIYNADGLLVQYPTFEWVWDDWGSTDPRAVHFKTTIPEVGGPGTRLTCWDCGSERGFPSDGYFNATLAFPSGEFMLSLYAYDKEGYSRTSETIYITDTDGAVLESVEIGGTEFDDGIYVQFWVIGPTTVVVQVKKDSESINAVLSGIFVDKGYVTTFDILPEVAWIIVDGVNYTANELPKSFISKAGSTHTFLTASMINGTGTRYVFTQWDDGSKETSRTIVVDSSKTYTAQFKTQHFLTVDSPYGNPQGEGWYDEGSMVNFSVTTPVGIIVQQVFTSWSVDSKATTSSATIIMDRPYTVVAQWKTDYTQLLIVVGIVIMTIVAVSALYLKRRKPQISSEALAS